MSESLEYKAVSSSKVLGPRIVFLMITVALMFSLLSSVFGIYIIFYFPMSNASTREISMINLISSLFGIVFMIFFIIAGVLILARIGRFGHRSKGLLIIASILMLLSILGEVFVFLLPFVLSFAVGNPSLFFFLYISTSNVTHFITVGVALLLFSIVVFKGARLISVVVAFVIELVAVATDIVTNYWTTVGRVTITTINGTSISTNGLIQQIVSTHITFFLGLLSTILFLIVFSTSISKAKAR